LGAAVVSLDREGLLLRFSDRLLPDPQACDPDRHHESLYLFWGNADLLSLGCIAAMAMEVEALVRPAMHRGSGHRLPNQGLLFPQAS
jgi:hypothetical protein